MSTVTPTRSAASIAQPALHAADSHDLIRVQGARVNNLKDISIEVPKRRLTVYTGVSGSGKSSLVFGTIAAESQRLINETYSAFVERAVTFTVCPDCGGTRFSAAARSSKIRGINVAAACAMQISDLAAWVRGLDEPSVAPLLAALQQTVDSFAEIGLGYLSLDRTSGTLSGGEAQRTKMIRHLGSSATRLRGPPPAELTAGVGREPAGDEWVQPA